MSGVIAQTATEYLDWTINWASRGLGVDTITSSAWSASSSDVTLNNSSHDNTTSTIWITGGGSGQGYIITNTIVTSGGRTMQESIPYTCLKVRMI